MMMLSSSGIQWWIDQISTGQIITIQDMQGAGAKPGLNGTAFFLNLRTLHFIWVPWIDI
jgi:hypothetical protein